MQRISNSRPQKRGGTNPSVVLLGGILVMAMVVIAFQMGGGNAAEKEVVKAEPYDAFASIPREERPTSSGSGSSSSSSSGVKPGTADDPFADISNFRDDQRWIDAEAKAAKGDGLLEDALAAHADGNRQKAKEKGSRAQKFFSEALTDSLPVQQELERARGEDSSPVKRISKLRQNWTRKVMTLKKSAFM